MFKKKQKEEQKEQKIVDGYIELKCDDVKAKEMEDVYYVG